MIVHNNSGYIAVVAASDTMAPMLVEETAAPTLSDAKRAGAQLVKAGASRVLLFGSVANGEARLRSDIDLVAIFDDIDYRDRLAMQLSLQAAAEDAAGRRVEVLVTDWPEWRCRTERVTASFEAAVAADAVVLFDREPGEVAWDKEIGLPDDNKKEALEKLTEAWHALTSVLEYTSMKESEWIEFDAGRVEGLERERHWRLVAVCRHSAEAIETSVKCLTALGGGPMARLSGPEQHRIDLLVDNLKQHGRQAAEVLEPLQRPTVAGARGALYEDVSMWRQAGTYVAERPEITPAVSSRLAPLLAEAAVEMTALAAGEAATKHGDECAAAAKRLIGVLRAALRDRDLIRGTPGRGLSPG